MMIGLPVPLFSRAQMFRLSTKRVAFRPTSQILRYINSAPPQSAIVSPITLTGLPPLPPQSLSPNNEEAKARILRRRKQAKILNRETDSQITANEGTERRRFWKEVNVREVDGGFQIYLDTRPIRRANSQILVIPISKPHLATAIALEWDLLTFAKQALKPHLIPLVSLVSRVYDIVDSDSSPVQAGAIRSGIIDTLMRYLETDSILCWVPLPSPDPPGYEVHQSRTEPLRVLQQRAAKPILEFLECRVWPGTKIEPVLDTDSIMPKSQDPTTCKVIREWLLALDPWDLAAIERATLAGKGLLLAVRLVVEWSENFVHLRKPQRQDFGIEEAASVANLEVEWQIDMWGLVEDTHDVDREDIRRQLGSAILLVSGTKTQCLAPSSNNASEDERS
ncbi:unnamed protein product [Blumeria hordei]|uniref:ATP synthase mitochondrial F1 complex assembly factor 2 n=1 Tax=Blumeria hordei TaxID=2867405 RepID=A0A383UKG1_BLUHO|nr:unnamed protein product [Blumeria hordei]